MNKTVALSAVELLLASAAPMSALPSDWVGQGFRQAWGSLNDVIKTDSLFVAVGDSVLTSPDGVTWTARSAGVKDSLQSEWQMQSVAWTGKLLVAAGGYYAKPTQAKRGFIVTSPDGVVWTERETGARSFLHSVIWSGDLLVAVGDSGSICTSEDGITWTTRNSGTENWLFDAVWTGTQFVAVGNKGTVRTSPDGTAWTKRTMDTTKTLTSVAWTGKRLVAVGYGGATFYSEDGITWYDRTVKPQYPSIQTSYYSVAWIGSTLMTVGVTSYGSRGEAFIASSEDGTTLDWRGTGGSIIPSTKWSPSAVAWCGDQVVVVGRSTILTYSAGSGWTNRSLGTYWPLRSVVWTGAQYVAVGDRGTIRVSPDGINWTPRYSGTTTDLASVAWNGTNLAAVGAGTILTSTDGTAWTLSGRSETSLWGTFHSVASNGSLFVAAGSRILTSPDGVAWTVRDSSVSGYKISVSWTGTRFVAIGDSISFSPDGMDWTTQPFGRGGLNHVIPIGTGFAGVGNSGVFATSPDGIAWDTVDLHVGIASLYGVAWSGSSFVAAGEYRTLLTSTDGVNWTNIGGTPNSDWHYLTATWTGNRFFITDNDGGIYGSLRAPVNVIPDGSGKRKNSPRLRVVGGLVLVPDPSASHGNPARTRVYRLNGKKTGGF